MEVEEQRRKFKILAYDRVMDYVILIYTVKKVKTLRSYLLFIHRSTSAYVGISIDEGKS